MDRRQEFEVIGKICERAEALGLSDPKRRFTLLMDLDKTNESVGLDLVGLLEADELNFSHDIIGIQRHINRETGELMDFFLPRYAKQDVSSLVENATKRSQEQNSDKAAKYDVDKEL